jgi:hypothetical protein
MRRFALLFPLLFLLFCAHGVYAQLYMPKQVKVKPRPAFPEYQRYSKKKPVKTDPYSVDSLMHPIPFARVGWHDKIYKEQEKADKSDDVADYAIRTGKDTSLAPLLTEAMLSNIDSMKVMIENMPPEGRDSITENQQKIRYLRAVWEMMRLFNRDTKPDAIFYYNLSANMRGMLRAINQNKLMDFVVANTNIYTLDNSNELFEPHSEERTYLYTQLGKKDPLLMAKRLEEFASDSFASAIISDAAHLNPELIFSYANSTNFKLKSAVFRTQDPLVQAIVQIAAHSKSPNKAFPFLSDIYLGRKTVKEIDSITADPVVCYQNLVRLRMENDTLNRHAYNEELAYRSLRDYVRQMNALHEEKDDVRFRCVDSMSLVDLYYIMVNGQDEIYTSSFLGAFKRLTERMKPMKGNQLLDTLHYDHFRTFIRMCAGYNTLSDFLGTMNDTARTSLMTGFIGGLEQGNENDLEDAVDVADAFGSIRDSVLSDFLEKKVKENYELSYKEKSKKGMIIYSILARLFEGNKISNSDTGAIVASSRLHLPPINKVLYKDLVNDSGIVYQQAFFYGDKDGQDSYDSYMYEFRKDKNWQVDTGRFWTVISSKAGRKVVIYANLPLKEPDDDDAQDRLCQYLNDSGIHPSIVIHRGHSYHLQSTLKRINKNVKIVVLGSCGGYHNLALVLDRAPDAHIISSKQTGARAINEPIIHAINTRLVDGADIDWITMWRELEDYFKKKPDEQEKFQDYVPPYKNLGAIFIKAYRQMMASVK